ncbi:unnamed protein product [Dicrocoelium dendriticum]|nr:unnamed protein product [Dicrocoelium dendriticum]
MDKVGDASIKPASENRILPISKAIRPFVRSVPSRHSPFYHTWHHICELSRTYQLSKLSVCLYTSTCTRVKEIPTYYNSYP